VVVNLAGQNSNDRVVQLVSTPRVQSRQLSRIEHLETRQRLKLSSGPKVLAKAIFEDQVIGSAARLSAAFYTTLTLKFVIGGSVSLYPSRSRDLCLFS